jgi:hypothetical protein
LDFFFRKPLRKSNFIKFLQEWLALYANTNAFLIISHSCFLRMGNVSYQCCRENQNTHFVFRNFFEVGPVCKVMWKNIVQSDRPHLII